MSDAPEFTVMGAGLAGPLMTALLARRGYRTRLYELRDDPRVVDQGAGRSINLALSNRGLEALNRIGLAEDVRENAIPMRGRTMHSRAGELTFQPYGTKPHHVLHSVSRGGLNCRLLDALDTQENADVRFRHKCLDVDLDRGTGQLMDLDENREITVETGRVVGADGAFSRVRAAFARRSRFDYSQDYLTHGYKELEMPATASGDFALEPNALHIWPRRSFMMIALPNADRTFTCTLFWPYEGVFSFDAFRDDENVLAFFRRDFIDVIPLIPDLAEQYRRNPVGNLVTVRCSPWNVGDKAVLVGDAAHAVVPFYGQGMNAAFEDCSVLDDCVERHASDWGKVFRAYTRLRKENVDVLADLALANFVEMRDHVGTARFRLHKMRERFLARVLPGWYVPLYSMISFSNIPYAEARHRALIQERVIRIAVMVFLAVVLAAILLITF